MKNLHGFTVKALSTMVVFAILVTFQGQAFAATVKPIGPAPAPPEQLANAPQPQTDSFAFHRGEDYTFGALIAMPIGMASKPWIGLLAAEGAGIANEARYGSHFNAGHLAVISAGALTGYALAKWEKHVARKQDEKRGYAQ
jgi:hypothetical protein